MGEMKSAREIAQERANRLGKLSREEERKQKEQECCQIAQGIVQSYLDSPGAEDIAARLDKYQGEERELILAAVVGLLTGAVTLDGGGRVEKAARGMVALEPGTQPVVGRMMDLLAEYHQAGERTRKEVEERAKGLLHQLRISGTAIGEINIKTSPQRQRAALEQQLDALKEEIQRGEG